MQIVIDIPEAKVKDPASIDLFYMVGAIKNGIPLPKGHGRLIDADALKNEWKNGFYKKIVDALMDDAPTIVEADRRREK